MKQYKLKDEYDINGVRKIRVRTREDYIIFDELPIGGFFQFYMRGNNITIYIKISSNQYVDFWGGVHKTLHNYEYVIPYDVTLKPKKRRRVEL